MALSVKKFYSANVKEEWNRLVQDPYHELEFKTTLFFLKKYLPKKGLILDAGGGPGRYTIELAKLGYEIVLLDLTPANLEFAKRQIKKAGLEQRLKELKLGSIRNLSDYADNTFDAIICLGGPLSHLIKKQDREKSVSELIRVAKSGAPVFVSVIGRLAVLASALRRFPQEILYSRFKKYRDTGDYAGDHGFTACHFFLPEELTKIFGRKDFEIITLAGLEGIASNLPLYLNKLAKDKKRWPIWWQTHLKTCMHPSVVGLSEHFLILGKKK